MSNIELPEKKMSLLFEGSLEEIFNKFDPYSRGFLNLSAF